MHSAQGRVWNVGSYRRVGIRALVPLSPGMTGMSQMSLALTDSSTACLAGKAGVHSDHSTILAGARWHIGAFSAPR